MGVNVIDMLVPKNDGAFAVTDAAYAKGGHREVDDEAARLAITTARRSAGMLVYQRDNGLTYRLGGDLTTWDIAVSTGGGSSSDVATGDITVLVDSASGSDSATDDRPARLTTGDYSAYPFATIQAALSALPITVPYPYRVMVDVAAGTLPGASLRGIKSWHTFTPYGPASWGYSDYGFQLRGATAAATPATGAASGTASAGGDYMTLTKAGAGWTVNDSNLRGRLVKITGGPGFSALAHRPNVGIIRSNTADTLIVWFFDLAFASPDAGSTFEILDNATLPTPLESLDSYSIGAQNCTGILISNFLPNKGAFASGGIRMRACDTSGVRNITLNASSSLGQGCITFEQCGYITDAENIACTGVVNPIVVDACDRVDVIATVFTTCHGGIWCTWNNNPRISGFDFLNCSVYPSITLKQNNQTFVSYGEENGRTDAQFLRAIGCAFVTTEAVGGSGNTGIALQVYGGGYVAADFDSFNVAFDTEIVLDDLYTLTYAQVVAEGAVIGLMSTIATTDFMHI